MLAVPQHVAATPAQDDSEEFYGGLGMNLPRGIGALQRALKAEEQTLLLREALHRIRSEINAALARPGVGEPENQKPVSEGASAADTISRLLRERDLLLLRLDQFAVRAREAEGRVTDLRRQLDALRSAINEALKI
jgi:hypothetical protein